MLIITKEKMIKSEHANTDNKNSLIDTNNLLNASIKVPVNINTSKTSNSHILRKRATHRIKNKNNSGNRKPLIR